jgi:hypothetical protein
MAELVAGDMLKIASSGQYAGSKRPDIFQSKIDDKRPFIIGKNKSGKVVNGVRYDKKAKTLSYYVGNKKSVITTVPYNRVFKDKDFGGGAGSGGGAEDTQYTESLQCYYCSYVFNVAGKQVDCVTDANLKKGEKFVKASVSLKDCQKNGPSDWIATDVYLKSANALFQKFGKKMTSPVYFHRDSTFMKNLYEAKKTTHKIDKKSEDQQAPGSFSNDKWNPGDIWASTEPTTSKPLDECTSSWGELNAKVYKLGSGTKVSLLGISLKKVGKNSKAVVKEYGTPKSRAAQKSYKYEGFTFGQTGEFFNSQDIYIHTNVGDVQFRTFSGETSWQGEIKGGDAAGGKIGGGNIDFYCREVFGSSKGIYNGYDTESGLVSWIKSNEKNGAYQELMWDLYKKHNSKSKLSKKILKEEDFYAELAAKDYKFKNSKLMCMLFIDRVQAGTAAKRDDVTTKIFRYAQSDVDQSSYFVKVY